MQLCQQFEKKIYVEIAYLALQSVHTMSSECPYNLDSGMAIKLSPRRKQFRWYNSNEDQLDFKREVSLILRRLRLTCFRHVNKETSKDFIAEGKHLEAFYP